MTRLCRRLLCSLRGKGPGPPRSRRGRDTAPPPRRTAAEAPPLLARRSGRPRSAPPFRELCVSRRRSSSSRTRPRFRRCRRRRLSRALSRLAPPLAAPRASSSRALASRIARRRTPPSRVFRCGSRRSAYPRSSSASSNRPRFASARARRNSAFTHLGSISRKSELQYSAHRASSPAPEAAREAFRRFAWRVSGHSSRTPRQGFESGIFCFREGSSRAVPPRGGGGGLLLRQGLFVPPRKIGGGLGAGGVDDVRARVARAKRRAEPPRATQSGAASFSAASARRASGDA